jgi:small subunit ribosomal protein S16
MQTRILCNKGTVTMSVKIRLSRAGKKHEPFHRVVVMDSRQKRNGEVITTIGTIDAIKGVVVRFDLALYDAWIAKGAQPTDSAKKLYKQAKKESSSAVVEAGSVATAAPKAKKVVKKETTDESKDA